MHGENNIFHDKVKLKKMSIHKFILTEGTERKIYNPSKLKISIKRNVTYNLLSSKRKNVKLANTHTVPP